MGRAAPRVQRVQRVLPASSGRVQRVWYRRFAAMSFYMLPAGGKNLHNRASPVEMHPFCLRHLSTGKHVTGFSGRFTPLQIQFLCHLKGKRDVTGMPLVSPLLHDGEPKPPSIGRGWRR